MQIHVTDYLFVFVRMYVRLAHQIHYGLEIDKLRRVIYDTINNNPTSEFSYYADWEGYKISVAVRIELTQIG